jgi:hypothetical protein
MVRAQRRYKLNFGRTHDPINRDAIDAIIQTPRTRIQCQASQSMVIYTKHQSPSEKGVLLNKSSRRLAR